MWRERYRIGRDIYKEVDNMAEENVRGRIPLETNPGNRRPGFQPVHDSTGNEDYVRTSPENPLPTKDADVGARLDAIESKLDSVIENGAINTQLTGSIVEYEIDTDFTVPEGDSVEYRVKMMDAFGNMPEYWGYSLYLKGNTKGVPLIEIRQGTGDNSAPVTSSIFEREFSRFSSIPPTIEVDGYHPFAINIYVKSDTAEMNVNYLKLWAYVRG